MLWPVHVTTFHSEMISVQKKWSGTRTQPAARVAALINLSKRSVATMVVAPHALQVGRSTVRLHSGGGSNGRRRRRCWRKRACVCVCVRGSDEAPLVRVCVCDSKSSRHVHRSWTQVALFFSLPYLGLKQPPPMTTARTFTRSRYHTHTLSLSFFLVLAHSRTPTPTPAKHKGAYYIVYQLFRPFYLLLDLSLSLS